MKEIPIIRIPFSDDDITKLQESWEQVLNSGFLTLGTHTARFEEKFKEFTGAKYAVAVANGTAALEIIIRSLNIEGKSIIVPTNTFLASALAVAHAGNQVIFADSDPETLSLDPEDVAKKIQPDTAAVMTVHIGGIIDPNIKIIQDLCTSKSLFLIEDCAHAHGSVLNGRHAGLLGKAGGFSFFPTKTLTTGEGGMVITDDEALYTTALMLRNQGKNPGLGGRISEFGHNWRINELTAALGVQQMEKAPDILDSRQRIAEFYDAALEEFQGLRSADRSSNSASSHYKYIAYLDPKYQRSDVKRVMKDQYGISLPGEVYADLCHTEPIWENYTYCGKRRTGDDNIQCNRWPGCGCGDTSGEFPGAEYISKYHICLPMYPGLEKDDLQYVIDSLENTLRKDLA